MSSCQLQLLIGALKHHKKQNFHTLLTMVVKIQMEHQYYTKMRIFIFDLKFEHISLGTQPELNRLPPPEIPAYHDRMQQIFQPNHEECYG